MGWKDSAVKLDESVPEWKKSAIPLNAPQGPGLGQTVLEQSGQGALMGYLPNVQAAAQPVTDRLFGMMSQAGIGPRGGEEVKPAEFTKEDYVKNRDINTARLEAQKQAYPGTALVSQLGGGLVSGIAAAPLSGATKAAGLLGAIGRGAGQGAVMGAIQNPGDTKGEISGPQIPERAGMGAVGGLLGGALGGVGNIAVSQGKKISSIIRPPIKPNAGEITAATRELGAEPTVGMITSSPVVQKIESSLYQTPHAEGDIVRQSVGKVQEALANGARQIEAKASQNSAFEIGEQIKKDLIASVGEKYGPVQAVYQGLGPETQAILIPKPRLEAVANNILNHEDAILQNRGIAKNIADELSRIENVSQLGRLKSAVGSQANQAYRSGDTQAGQFLSQIMTKLDRLEKGSITRSAIESAGEKEGLVAAKGVIEDLREARKGYRGLMQYLESIGEYANIKGKKSPAVFVNKIESIPSEQLATRMIKKNDVEAMRSMKEVLPDQFESLKQLEIANLISKSRKGEEVSIPKLLNNADKYSPEMKEILLGKDGINILDNMKKTYGARPEKVGPSGTPEGMSYKEFGQFISPKYWIDVLGRKAQGAMYQGAQQSVKGQPLTGAARQMDKAAGLLKELGGAAPGAATLPQNFYEYIKGRP